MFEKAPASPKPTTKTADAIAMVRWFGLGDGDLDMLPVLVAQATTLVTTSEFALVAVRCSISVDKLNLIAPGAYILSILTLENALLHIRDTGVLSRLSRDVHSIHTRKTRNIEGGEIVLAKGKLQPGLVDTTRVGWLEALVGRRAAAGDTAKGDFLRLALGNLGLDEGSLLGHDETGVFSVVFPANNHDVFAGLIREGRCELAAVAEPDPAIIGVAVNALPGDQFCSPVFDVIDEAVYKVPDFRGFLLRLDNSSWG